MAKVKIYISLFITLLVLVVIFQNREPVETSFLFFSVVMPRAALLGITLLIGGVAGFMLGLVFSKRK